MLTEEAIDNVIEDKEEREVIASRMVPMMLVGGLPVSPLYLYC